jgi:hypothetical protein
MESAFMNAKREDCVKQTEEFLKAMDLYPRDEALRSIHYDRIGYSLTELLRTTHHPVAATLVDAFCVVNAGICQFGVSDNDDDASCQKCMELCKFNPARDLCCYLSLEYSIHKYLQTFLYVVKEELKVAEKKNEDDDNVS